MQTVQNRSLPTCTQTSTSGHSCTSVSEKPDNLTLESGCALFSSYLSTSYTQRHLDSWTDVGPTHSVLSVYELYSVTLGLTLGQLIQLDDEKVETLNLRATSVQVIYFHESAKSRLSSVSKHTWILYPLWRYWMLPLQLK